MPYPSQNLTRVCFFALCKRGDRRQAEIVVRRLAKLAYAQTVASLRTTISTCHLRKLAIYEDSYVCVYEYADSQRLRVETSFRRAATV